MAPRLSFVLAVHREQAFLEPCLASILGQDMSDLEVVAVDDASDDHAPEVLDAIAQRDPRVRVTHLPQRVGRGAARNLAVEQATGEYVWVVRATDLVERIPQLDGDVMLLHSTRESPIGRRSPGPRQTGLGDVSPDVFDKVFRRGLLGGFGPAGFDELTAIWPALLAAERIATPDGPAYIRRQPPNAVPHGTVWDALDQYAALGDRAPQLRAAIRRHGVQLARNLHGGERRRFLRRVEELSQTKGLAIRAEAGAARRRLRALPGRTRRGVKRATARSPGTSSAALSWIARGLQLTPRYQ